jgi:hypothetical protein
VDAIAEEVLSGTNAILGGVQEMASAAVRPLPGDDRAIAADTTRGLAEPRVSDSDLTPISPELVLVSSPEIARRARYLLPEPSSLFKPSERDERTRQCEEGAGLTSPVAVAPAESVSEIPHSVLAVPFVEVLASRRKRVASAPAATIVLVVIAGAASFLAATNRGGMPPRRHAQISDQPHPLSAKAQARKDARASREQRAARNARRKAGSSAAFVRPRTPRGNEQTLAQSELLKSAVRPRSGVQRGVRTEVRGASPAFVPSRVFSWPASRGATSYVVHFFRNGRKVIDARTTKPRLRLPLSFHFKAGRYRWEVIPVLRGSRTPPHAPSVVESSFVLTPASAEKAKQ